MQPVVMVSVIALNELQQRMCDNLKCFGGDQGDSGCCRCTSIHDFSLASIVSADA